MESQISNGMCRCCASQGTFKDVRTAYHWMGEEEVYSDMLRDCLDVTLCTDMEGNINGGICEVCITQLRNAANFKRQVLDTEEQFKLRMSDKLFKQDIVKVELAADNDDSDRDNLSDNFSEYEVPIKMEDSPAEVKPKKRKAAAKASTSRVKKTKTEAGESSKRVPHVTTKLHTRKGSPKITEVRSLAVRNIIKKTKCKNMNIKVIDPIPSGSNALKNKLEVIVKTEVLGDDKIGNSDFDDNLTGLGDSKSTTTKVKDIDVTDTTLSVVQKQRENVKEILTCTNASPIRKGGIIYTCCFCTEHFTNPQALKDHNLITHNDTKTIHSFMKTVAPSAFLVKLDITDLKCKLCAREIPSLDEVIQHLSTVHDRKIHTEIAHHIVPFKFLDRTMRCTLCESTYSSFSTLLKHMHSHYKNYICYICNASFVNSNVLATHIRQHKESAAELRYPCEFCPNKYPTYSKLNKHNKNTHSGAKYKCPFCNETFKEFYHRVTHLSTVHDINSVELKCDTCNKTFSRINHLNRHRKRYHTGELKSSCSVCVMKFHNKMELLQHMTTHIGATFTCEHCGKVFLRKDHLRGHMRIHIYNIRFKCNHCGKIFNKKGNLKIHLRTIHDDSSFVGLVEVSGTD